MTTQTIEIAARDGMMDAHFTTPDGNGTHPGIVMFTDILGPRPETDGMAERLAAMGFAVLTPNPYYRTGPAPVLDLSRSTADPDFLAEAKALAMAIAPGQLDADSGAAIDALLARPEVTGERVNVVGYCIGGRHALRAAAIHADRIALAASFHGGDLAGDAPDSPHRLLDRVRAELYFGHAENDRNMPAEMIARLEAALAETDLDWTSEIYAAAHGFSVPGMRAYQEEAAERHWRTLERLLGTRQAA